MQASLWIFQKTFSIFFDFQNLEITMGPKLADSKSIPEEFYIFPEGNWHTQPAYSLYTILRFVTTKQFYHKLGTHPSNKT